MPGLNLPPPTAGANGAGPSKQARVDDVDDMPTISAAAAPAGPAQNGSAAGQANRFATGGVIYPPPDIRSVVDRTASFVARLGKPFEDKMRSEDTSGKLAFLSADDPYHAYYLQALENGGSGGDAEGDKGAARQTQDGIDGAQAEVPSGQEEEIEEPTPYLFSAEVPPTTAIDLDILKLTALFTAARGRAFASELTAKEAQSFQFEFLRPSHSLFPFFNRLVEQYQLALEAPEEVHRAIETRTDGSADGAESSARRGAGVGGCRSLILADLQRRSQWEKRLKDTKRRKEDEEAEMRAAFDEIDWQDFVVVQTVEITEDDMHLNLPLPLSIRDLEGMSLAQKKLASMIMDPDGAEDAARGQETSQQPAEDGDVMDMESGGEEEEESGHQQPSQPAPVPQPASARPAPGGDMKIRKNYVPKALAQRQQAETTTSCPVCGLKVPLKEMDEHVRIELLNPRYRDQRREVEAKQAQHRALQSGADPVAALRQYAGARTDIFGAESEEAARLRREEEERRKARERERVVYDGHLASKATTLERAQKLAQSSESVRAREAEQRKAEAPSIGPQVAQPAPTAVQPTMQEQHAPAVQPTTQVQHAAEHVKRPAEEPADGQPPAQRQMLSAPATSALPASTGKLISIQLPDNTSVSSLCDGRLVSLEPLPPSTSISQIRDIVHDTLLETSIGASRIKLKLDGKALTLKQTLASLDMGEAATLEVTIK